MNAARRHPRLLAAALAAADRGWPVFPLWPGLKRPAITGWPRAATCEPAKVAAWWRDRPYNIGIACGPAGLLVVDFDGPGTIDLPGETYTVATPSGQHRYFTVESHRPGRCTAGVLASHVDTRAVGGYVVGAGSVRSVDSRRCYYRVVAPGSDPIPAPAWLLTALEPAASPPRDVPDVATMDLTSYGRAALASEVARVRAAEQGSRNTAVFTAGVHLGELVAADVLDEHEVVRELLHACGAHIGSDGFTAAEADRALGNGLRYGRRRPRPIS